MPAMADSKKYPKTLSAPVDEDTWKWFNDQAEAQFRKAGAHLRWLILEHRKDVDSVKLAESFSQAVAKDLRVPITESMANAAAVYAKHPLPEPEPEPDEGMT